MSARREKDQSVPEKKTGLLGWFSKKDYTDVVIDSLNNLCDAAPIVLKNYASSTNKIMFAVSNIGSLLKLKKSLDAIDDKTWVPRVKNDDLLEIANAYNLFLNKVVKHSETVLVTMQDTDPQDIEYFVVNKFPRKPKVGAIYIQKVDDKIKYCYQAESDPGQIITGSKDEKILGVYKDLYTDPGSFKKYLSMLKILMILVTQYYITLCLANILT